MTSAAIFLFAACPKDLANQIRHWDVYLKEIAQRKASPGSFLNPLAAEWFSGPGLNCKVNFFGFQAHCKSLHFVSGLPLHWTDPEMGKISPQLVEQMLPRGQADFCFVHASLHVVMSGLQAKTLGCVSLFSGCAGLELGLRSCLWHF